MTNQTPEQIARDEIDRQLIACGWVIQPVGIIGVNEMVDNNKGLPVQSFH
ncbi:hypothetical protein [Parasediminibacterium sp. JCM 36343]